MQLHLVTHRSVFFGTHNVTNRRIDTSKPDAKLSMAIRAPAGATHRNRPTPATAACKQQGNYSPPFDPLSLSLSLSLSKSKSRQGTALSHPVAIDA